MIGATCGNTDDLLAARKCHIDSKRLVMAMESLDGVMSMTFASGKNPLGNDYALSGTGGALMA